jgi:hypothetical protein
MKSPWYFIIAGAGVVAFAIPYQGYTDHETARQAELAATKLRDRERQIVADASARHIAAEKARVAAEVMRQAQAAKASQQADELAQRQQWRRELDAAHDEIAALHLARDRVARDLDAAEARIAAQQRELRELKDGQGFMRTYIAAASANATRLQQVAENVVAFALPEAAPSPRRPGHQLRRTSP